MLLRKLRYRVILQYLKYTIFRKLIVPYAIFKILLLIAVAPSFLCTFRIAHRILGTKKTRASAGSAAWQCNHSYHDMQIFTIVNYFFADKIQRFSLPAIHAQHTDPSQASLPASSACLQQSPPLCEGVYLYRCQSTHVSVPAP